MDEDLREIQERMTNPRGSAIEEIAARRHAELSRDIEGRLRASSSQAASEEAPPGGNEHGRMELADEFDQRQASVESLLAETERTQRFEASVRDALDLALDGDLDDAAAQLGKAMASVAPAVDPEAIVEAAVHLARTEVTWESFSKRHAALLAADGAGAQLDAEFGRRAPRDDDGNIRPMSPDQFDEILETCAAAVKAQVQSRTPPEEIDSPEARSRVIEEIARSRGGRHNN